MARAVVAAAVLSTFAASAAARHTKPAERAPLRLATQQDHKLMMEALRIRSLWPGANGLEPRAANAANYDESKADPYPNLPDPVVLKNGEEVTTAEMWWTRRRPEIVEDFDREVNAWVRDLGRFDAVIDFDARMVYGVDGSRRVCDQRARKGDTPSPPFRATRDTMLVASPVHLTAPYSRARTVSGQ